jgi:outer membrane protein assembly factor BamD (BamD/ComL family)
MSIVGILGSGLLASLNSQGAQNKFQQINSEFRQLGRDLTSGNLTQAQQDFATLSQNLPGQQHANSSTGSNASPLAQAFSTLSDDLQSGNLTGAQQAFSTLQQDLQQQGSGQVGHHHHHFGGGQGSDAGTSSSAQSNPVAQAFGQLETALQSGNLSSAQQAYSTLQQDLQQYLPSFASPSGSTAQVSGGTANLIA